MSKVLFAIYRYACSGIFLIITIWLFLLSIFSTSRMTTDASEFTFYIGDYAWLHLIIFLIIGIITYFLVKTEILSSLNMYFSRNYKAWLFVRNILLLVIGIIGTTWVLLTQPHAGADQYYVLKAAHDLKTGDYSYFMKGGYISKYTNQIGLLFIEYILGFIVGDYNYLFWQLLNVVMVVFTFKLFSDILSIWKLPRLASLLCILMGILFFPWTLYSVFIYGTIAGLFFSLIAFKYTILYIQDCKKNDSIHVSYIIISSLGMMLSVMVKSNYLIFMIALIIYTIAHAISLKNIKVILVTLAVIAGFCIQAVFPKMVIEKISGYSLNNGASSWTWIDMGLNTINGNIYADGWYNYRIASLYEANDCDPEAESLAAKAEIAQHLDNYKNNPSAFTLFLSRKIASQWNNPGFQCFWITSVRSSSIKQSSIITNTLSENGQTVPLNYLNILQSVILLGSLLYAIDALFHNTFNASTILPLTFIGGFIFHIFWEGKCQYTLPYFILLIPLCIMGFYNFSRHITDLSRNRLIKYGIAAAIGILITIIFNKFIILNYDNKSYASYHEYQLNQGEQDEQ